MRWLTIIAMCLVTCASIGLVYQINLGDPQSKTESAKSQAKSTQDEKETPHESRAFSFDFSNVTDDTVWVDSLHLPRRVASSSRVWANGDGYGEVSSRGDCTPEILLDASAKFLWWKRKDPLDSNLDRKRPSDPAKLSRDSMLLPWFDVEADAWNCFFTLQTDNTWVGRFEGAVLKPMGAKPESLKRSPREGNQQWIQFQFCNLTDREICFPLGGSDLVNAAGKTDLHIPNIPNDKNFHGITAHRHKGSIYRPAKGDQIELVWCIPAYRLQPGDDKGTHSQTIKLPSFDPKVENWFCYFTLSAEGTWSSVFEGKLKE
ncbi:MAG: hypothetical protein AB8B55_08710 [Mariniblastus sp.]